MEANEVVQVTLLGGRAAQSPDAAESRLRKRILRLVGQSLPVVVCELALLVQDAAAGRGWILALVALPYLLSAVLAWRIDVVAGREGLRLYLPDLPEACGHPDAAADAARRAWSYERDRYRRSVERTGYYANQLGALTSVLLAVLLLGGHLLQGELSGASGVDRAPGLLVAVGVSVMASVVTAFLVLFVGSMVRLSSYDISARAFTWAARSVVLVAAATAGLAAAIAPTQPKTMLLLGILTGVTGHHALDLFLDKANELLGMKKGATQSPSPVQIQSIDAVLPEHVSRLEEEGLVSLQDLAYAPTARLFFSLPYGLQAVCAFQDDALLRAKLGPERASDLFRCLGIRGAVAFRDLARRELGRQEAPGAATGDREALVRALRLEKDASLTPLLQAFVNDSTVDRLAAYERAVVLEPAQFDRCAPEAGAEPLVEVVRARTTAFVEPEPQAREPQVAAASAGQVRGAGWLLASLWIALARRGHKAGARARPAHGMT